MPGAIHLVLLLAAVAFPFVMMPLMWRRMKRVQRVQREARERQPVDQHGAAWEESLGKSDDLRLVRRHAPNDELIDLGDRANHAQWPLNND